jgi:hypothetical protein
VQIAIKRDEYLTLEIVKVQEKNKSKLTWQESLEEQRERAYL